MSKWSIVYWTFVDSILKINYSLTDKVIALGQCDYIHNTTTIRNIIILKTRRLYNTCNIYVNVLLCYSYQVE